MNAPTLVRAAHPFKPSSVDEKSRTVELIASTGAGVMRRDLEGDFLEVLEVSAKAVDLTCAEGMPLLDSHRQDGLDRVLGVVRGIRFEAGNLIVKVEFSPRAEAVWQDVRAGIIANVSVGYQPIEWRDADGPQGRIRTLTKWQLHEVSLVAVGADPAAKTRNSDMPTNTPADPAVTTPAAPPAPVSRAAVNAEIRALGELFQLRAQWSNELIDANATEEQARTRAIEAVRSTTTTPRVTIVAQHDGDPTAFVRNAATALYVSRVAPRAEMPEPARRFAHMTLLDLARESLAIRSISTTGLSPADTIGRALTTSDFPAVLGGVGERVLREQYQQVPSALKAVAKQTTAKDFKAKSSIQLSEAPTLEKVNERGEYSYGALADATESYAIDTFGKIISLSRKAIINDDLSAFSDLSGLMGRAASDFEASFLMALLTKAAGVGPTMDDSKALFHADHANLASPATALYASTGNAWDNLATARLARRKQTGLGGRPVAPEPKFLLVPPELETKGEALLAAIQPTATGDVNPFGGKLTLLVEPRLTSATAWYIVADPASVPGLEYAYLQGAEGPQIETRAGFEIDGVETKVRLDFGAGFVDWRGWHRNAGA